MNKAQRKGKRNNETRKTAARILALALAAVMAFGPSAAAKGSDHIGTEAQAARFSPGDLKRVEAFADEFLQAVLSARPALPAQWLPL